MAYRAWSLLSIGHYSFAFDRKDIEPEGTSTADLIVEADTKLVFNRAAITAANEILAVSAQAGAGTFPTEDKFFELLHQFRLATSV